MFYRKGRTAGYMSVHHFRLEHFLYKHIMYFFKGKIQNSQLKKKKIRRDMLNK